MLSVDGKTTDLQKYTLFCRQFDTIDPIESYPVYFLFFLLFKLLAHVFSGFFESIIR